MTDHITPEEARLEQIRREHRHAMATRRDPGDSWLNGYQDDIGYLLAERDSLAAQLEAAQDVIEATRRTIPYLLNSPLEGSLDRYEEMQEALARYDAARGEK